MHAVVGDRLHVRGNVVGHPDRMGEIVEVRDAGGEPPYMVRFDDGHTCLVFPGPDAVIEPKKAKSASKRKTAKAYTVQCAGDRARARCPRAGGTVMDRRADLRSE